MQEALYAYTHSAQKQSLHHSTIQGIACHAGLPVHINGYFELSSNRRNIWHSSLSSETSGAGKQKSDWNIALLEVKHQVTSHSMPKSVRCKVHLFGQCASHGDSADLHRRQCQQHAATVGHANGSIWQ